MKLMSSNGWRWTVWVASILIFVVIGLLWSRYTRIEDSGNWRIALSVIEWVAMFGAVFAFPNLDRRKSLFVLGAAVVLVRLCFWGAPVSNDVNRYLWEGRLLWVGENPYAAVADDESWAHLRDDYWDGMNTRDRMTAYPPGMELVMAGASRLWYHLHVFKIVALIGDLWILALLVILSREYVRPVRWLGFYAFNPIVLSSFAVEAHFDSMMVAPMLTALLFASREKWKGAWFWLGFAVQMKIMAVLLVPLLVIGANREESRMLLKRPFAHLFSYCLRVLKQSWPFFLMLVLPSLVYWQHLEGLLDGFFAFGSQGAFNGGFYELLRWLRIPQQATRLLGTLLFWAGVIVILFRLLQGEEKDLVKSAFWIFQLLLIFSPVVHFWYLSWIVWFLVIRPSVSLLILCGAQSVYFLAWTYSELGWGWGFPREVVILSWLPFMLLLLWENRHLRSRLRLKSSAATDSMSIVVPVYQEGPGLKTFLTDLQAVSPSELVREIIVVDGAGDLNANEVEKLTPGPPIRVLQSERGRGRQIAAGIAAVTGDLVTIIHADTQPRVGWVEEVMRAARKSPRTPAFALGQRFSKGGLGLLGVECMNEMRVAFGGSVFGDQTMIIRRSSLEEAGGFPQQPLMEDVEVSTRLRTLDEIAYLGREWTVSANKWERGFYQRFTQIIGLMIRYGLTRVKGTRHTEQLSNRLFQEYYPEDNSEKDQG